MSKLTLLIIALCLAELSFAQNDFREGYIISNAGDTVYGFVEYTEVQQMYRVCHFKKTDDQKVINYEPGQITGFGLSDNLFFESKEVRAENQKEQRVFAEVKVKGFVSLFRFDFEYYVEKNNGGLQRLSNENQKIYVNGKAMMHRTNQHVSVLSTLMFDCVELRQRVQNISLVEKQLIKLAEDYNRCMGQVSITYGASEPHVKVRFGIAGGINKSNIKFSNADGKYDYLGGSFDGSSTLIIGLSLDVFAPGVSKRISIHGEVLYTKSNYESVNSSTGNSGPKTSHVTIDLEQLKIPLGLRYTFPEKKITPYMNLGMSSTFNISSSSPLTTNYKLANRIETVFTKDALNTNTLQVGLWGGVGISKSIHKKLNLFTEIRYEWTNGVVDRGSEDQSLASSIQNIQITFGIRMK
jgi:Outer membrane protein beta-barrel domain